MIVATLYYTQCMFSSTTPMGVWSWFCDDDMQECVAYQQTGLWLSIIFGVLIFWQAMIEFYQMKAEGCADYTE